MSEVVNPFLSASNGKKMLTLVGIYVCTVFAIMQSSGLSIISPAAAMEFDGGTAGLAMSIYSLASSLTGPVSIILMPLWGYIAARSPHLKVPLVVISVLVGAAVILVRSLSTDIFVYIATGALYGFVSPGVFVVGFMLIRDMFEGAKMGVYMGLIGTMMAIGSLLAPVLTGFIVGSLGWRAACHILWPFFILGALMILFGVKVSRADGEAIAYKSGKIDLAGIFAVAIFLAPLICGISMGTSFIKFGTVESFVTFGIAIVALVALIIIIRRKGDGAVIPLSALKDRNTVMLATSNFFMNFANMFVFFFLPSYIMYVLFNADVAAGLAATDSAWAVTPGADGTTMTATYMGMNGSAWSGIIMACFAVFGLFLGPVFGRTIAKSGNARNVLVLGIVCRLVFLICLILFLTPGVSVFLLAGLALVFGGVYSTMATAYTTGVSVMAPAQLRQQSNAVVQMGQNLGGAPGTAVGGILIATFGVAGGMPIAFIVAAVAVAIMFIPTLLLKKPEGYGQEKK